MSGRRVQVPSLLGDPGIRRAARTPERRFLFAVPPLAGPGTPNAPASTAPTSTEPAATGQTSAALAAPTAAVAAELVRRGHKVAWTGHRSSLEARLRPGSRVYNAVEEDFGRRLAGVQSGWRERRGIEALRFRWEELLVPLGHAMLPGVEKAIDRFRPDVVVADQFALAAPVAARRREIPWATSATSPAEFTRPLADLPEEEEWVRDRIADFQLDHGIEDLLDLRFSDHLVLVFAMAGLVGDTSFFPGHFAFVGPPPGRSAPRAFPWDRLDGRPVVLITLDVPDDRSAGRFRKAAAEAVREMDVQAILVAAPDAVADPPPNVLVREQVPQAKLLEHVSAVVCQGTHETVCAALAQGIPLVTAPVLDDQPVIARQVEAAGAGITVDHTGARPDELRAALTTVLADGPHRAAAERFRESMDSAGGVAEAADRLEKLN